jgi:uncharacterized protein YmfQ (DUF2313 family)
LYESESTTEKILYKIYTAQQSEIDTLNGNNQDITNQCFVSTATWGLDIWESELGISTVLTDSYDIRRTRIKAKLRGQGTFNLNMLKNVVASFENGEIDISVDIPHYAFTIKFVSTLGIPPNIDDLKSAIEEIKPAHLAVNYQFTYNTWNDISNFSWDD